MNKEQCGDGCKGCTECRCDDDCGCDNENKEVVIVDSKGEVTTSVIKLNTSAFINANQGMSPEDAAQIEQLVEELAAKQVDPCEKVYPTLRNNGGDKLGRNDPCPCGSGKKWKKCCQLRF